jgi:hypothetical protein
MFPCGSFGELQISGMKGWENERKAVRQPPHAR